MLDRLAKEEDDKSCGRLYILYKDGDPHPLHSKFLDHNERMFVSSKDIEKMIKIP